MLHTSTKPSRCVTILVSADADRSAVSVLISVTSHSTPSGLSVTLSHTLTDPLYRDIDAEFIHSVHAHACVRVARDVALVGAAATCAVRCVLLDCRLRLGGNEALAKLCHLSLALLHGRCRTGIELAESCRQLLLLGHGRSASSPFRAPDAAEPKGTVDKSVPRRRRTREAARRSFRRFEDRRVRGGGSGAGRLGATCTEAALHRDAIRSLQLPLKRLNRFMREAQLLSCLR
jgi:hypothetical protein